MKEQLIELTIIEGWAVVLCKNLHGEGTLCWFTKQGDKWYGDYTKGDSTDKELIAAMLEQAKQSIIEIKRNMV